MGASQSPYSLKYALLQPLSSQYFGFSIACPNCYPLPQMAYTFANVTQETALELRRVKQRQVLEQILQGAYGELQGATKVKTWIHSSLR